MFLGRKIIAIILARGGSKGIKLKNLKKIGGKSLVYHAAKFCKKLTFLDEAVLSTDHNLIAKEGLSAGLKVPFKRPKNLSKDLVSDEMVIIDVIKKMEKITKKKYDIILSLPPTSPFRKKKDIINGIKLLIKKKLDSVWTINQNDSKNHPYKQLLITKKNRIKFFSKKGKKIFARQQLQPIYFRDGSAYIISRNTLLKKKTLITNNTGAIITNNFKISIDTPIDLELANFFYRKFRFKS